MKVTLLDHMGSDLTVVNAARVSFDKQSEWDECVGEDEHGRYLDKCLSTKDAKLIKYLAEHEHWSPFAHATVSFRVSAPIFVARQLQKHTVGLAWNEVSRRYVDNEPTFYTPDTWRKRAEDVKQGSGEDLTNADGFHMYYRDMMREASGFYDYLIQNGVCPEQARMVLPQSMMTEWIWTGSLYAFARVCNLRLDSHTQKETRFIAEEISKHMASLFPCSWSCLVRQPGADPNQGN